MGKSRKKMAAKEREKMMIKMEQEKKKMAKEMAKEKKKMEKEKKEKEKKKMAKEKKKMKKEMAKEKKKMEKEKKEKEKMAKKKEKKMAKEKKMEKIKMAKEKKMANAYNSFHTLLKMEKIKMANAYTEAEAAANELVNAEAAGSDKRKNKLNPRRRRAKKEREKALDRVAAAEPPSTECESPPKTPRESPIEPDDSVDGGLAQTSVSKTAHDEYRKSLQDKGLICHSYGLESYIYPTLCPRFPKRRETLSLDRGFAQTPTLKKILAHYGDFIPCAQDIVSESFRPHSKVRLKLRDIYSRIASSVVAVSSFFGLERKVDCSGFIVDWHSSEKEGTILTSAKVLCNPANSPYEFHLIVRMADGTLFLAKEDRVDFYNNILTLKVKSNAELKALDLTADIVGQESVTGLVERVVALGRSFTRYSFLDYVGELNEEYPRFGCDELLRSSCYASKICEGGPLITDTGHVIGINFFGNGICAHVLPTHIIMSCLERWRSLGTVMRPYFGFSVIDVKQAHFQMCERLNISHRESHVLVKEVFEGSVAHKNEVRSHDFIASLNGIGIHSARQYTELLSQAVTDCTHSSQPIVISIDTFGRQEELSFVAEYLSVDDMRFSDCWPQVEGSEWSREKFGSQKNPRFCLPPTPEEDTC